MSEKSINGAKPFLKWAGGKSQLLAQFQDYYPQELKTGKIKKYIEPFVGGGAVFFDIVQKYEMDSAYLYDINDELIIAYMVIQKNPEQLMESLDKLAKKFKSLNEQKQKEIFYKIRADYNARRSEEHPDNFQENWTNRAAQLIFLNKTCYNGLFRLNRNGEFNVPFGRYKNPKIFDAENILKVSQTLQMAEIRVADFEECEKFIDEATFVYFDPPYRPISQTSSFTSYSRFEFGDEEQKRLSQFYTRLDKKYGAKLMLSNSDPANENPDDPFFNNLYRGYHLHKVTASRMINCNTEKRGQISELLITNYSVRAEQFQYV